MKFLPERRKGTEFPLFFRPSCNKRKVRPFGPDFLSLKKNENLVNTYLSSLMCILGISHSIGLAPCSIRNSFAFEKCLQPKNPRYAESGLGCGAIKIKCFGLLSMGIFFCAGFPHSMNTMGRSCEFITKIIRSVNFSHPSPA